MPVVRRRPITEESTDNNHLRPYLHHGLQLSVQGNHAVGDCPFCGREAKFSVATATGLWRCFVCGSGTENGGGNALVFIRLLHELAMSTCTSLFKQQVASDRRLLNLNTVDSWGVCQSPFDSCWIVPGYNIEGRLDQLYRRVWMDEEWRLLPTPGIWPPGKVHALHLPSLDFDPKRPKIIVCEGPWDGMALWEVGNQDDTNIVAVPGCNVWCEEWTSLCRDKHVTLMFDSDHPLVRGNKTLVAGLDGMRRVAKKLNGVAALVKYIKWGPDGYDPDRPPGWDVRDHLSQATEVTDRCVALAELMEVVEEVPHSWYSATPSTNGKVHHSIEVQNCNRWVECETAWAEALQWRQDMSDALAVLLAVCASTQQSGNQLFLDLVGSAGSGKTTICEGLLVSKHCHHLEHLTGFHSGWREPGDDGKDCSLLSRINNKTLVTPEFDVMRSSPRYSEIMGQQRRIFDGKSGATYKNSKEDRLYEGLRTPWIRAGTMAIMDADQSQLGDRFLRFIISDPGESEKRAIIRAALRSERMAMLGASDGTSASLVDSKLRKAQSLTGGYVDWLRANVESRLSTLVVSQNEEEHCIDLAELSADLRARPNEDRRKTETHDSKELPTRLARQNIRMASCLAVALNKTEIDKDVLRIVRKIAFDTAHGHSLNIVQWLCSPNPKVGGRLYQECGGLMIETLSMWTGMTPERLHNYLMFLQKIGILEWKQVKQTNGSWLLTERVYDLYLRIVGG